MHRSFVLGISLLAAPFAHAATFTTSGLSPATNIQGENGYTAYHALASGDTIGGYTIPGNLDGIGAYLLDADTVRLIVNHELTNPAKISFVDVNRHTLAVEAASNGISSIIGSTDIDRFCSSAFWETATSALPGATNVTNFADPLYLTGEEVSGGSVYALDPSTGTLHEAPAVGNASWENITVLDTRGTDRVALLLGSDADNAPLYLYVGEKSGTGFLERNGLANGQIYVWKSDTPGETKPNNIVGGTTEGNVLEGSFVPLGASGTFQFERPEDVATNPFDGSQAIFATTGLDDGDSLGALWTVDIGSPDFTAIGLPSGLPASIGANITLTYDADDNSDGLYRPDNLDWADNGLVFVQTDGVSSGSEGIFQLDPTVPNPDPTRIAYLTTSGGTPTTSGETSGSLDVSHLFNQAAGSVLVGDTQFTGNELFFLVNQSLLAAPVPEPSRALLAAAALAGICLKRRRSRSRC